MANAKPSTFNIDEMKAEFEPLAITFRGAEYVMGRDILGLLDACDLNGSIEDKDGLDYIRELVKMLPGVVKCLCPELDLESMDDALETGEQMALVKACTEVLGRVGRLTFQAEDEGGADDS